MKLLVALWVVSLSSSASAVSFDSTKASTFVEKTICSDPLLGKLDDALSKNYKQMIVTDFGGSVIDLRNEQRQWVSSRNKCATRECLLVAYKKRIDETCDYGVVSGVHPDCVHAEDLESPPAADLGGNQEVLAPAHIAANSQQPQFYSKWKDNTGTVITCAEKEAKCFSRVMDDPKIGAVLRVYTDGRKLSYGGAANVYILDANLTDEEILNDPQAVIDRINAQEAAEDPINKEKECLATLKVGMTEEDALHCGKPTHQLHRTDGAAVLEYLFGAYGSEGFTVVMRNSQIREVQKFK
jgi:uncharacterized protein YecT (DUF1311 family)